MQTLVRNELRERVVVRVDGGVRNGRDILVRHVTHPAAPKAPPVESVLQKATGHTPKPWFVWLW